MALALQDWDPELVRKRMLERRERKDVLAAWAKNTEPESTHHWTLKPAMDRLDNTR